MAESRVVAKQAIKKLEDQLTCAICLDAFRDPKLLQCFHACLLQRLHASSDWSSKTIKDNAPYVAPPVDSPPSFPIPQLLLCLASSQHSTFTTFSR